jgi:hypothetical protein
VEHPNGSDLLTAASFRAHVGTVFEVADGPEPVALDLVSVTALDHRPDARRREPFSLLFDGPSSPLLPQRTYRLEHARLGRLEIFLVPVARGADGRVSYEAVFN